MEISVLKLILWSQFGAAIDTLQNAISDCPDTLWSNAGRKRPYWHLAYHALFFLDLYLSDSPEGFSPPAPFTHSEPGGSGKTPDRVYSRAELQTYLAHCREKCISSLEALTEEGALQRCAFRWLNMNIGELFLYNMRHVQHHAAQLNLILREELDLGSKWVSKTKQ